MFIAGLFSLVFRSTLLCMGFGAARGAAQGIPQAAVILVAVVALWNWRWILDFVADRRWRDYEIFYYVVDRRWRY